MGQADDVGLPPPTQPHIAWEPPPREGRCGGWATAKRRASRTRPSASGGGSPNAARAQLARPRGV